MKNDNARIRETFIDYYKEIFNYGKDKSSFEGVNEVINKRILEDLACDMNGEVTREEIERSIFGMAKNKVVFFKKT